MADQNKIAKTLSAEELAHFCERLSKTRKVTLQTIADFYEEETGEKVSLMGATSFRDTTFARHLQAIGSAADLHKQMLALKTEGVGVGAAAELIINQKLIDQLIEFETTKSAAEDGGIEALNALSKITKRLTDSERGRHALEHRIDQDQDDAARRVLRDKELLAYVAAIARDSSIDEGEKVARIRKRLFGERPADWQPVKTTGAEVGQ